MTIATEYWTAANEGELRLPRCDSCSAWIWYPRAVCLECGGSALAWQSVEAVGRIYSWTRVRHPYVKDLQEFLPLTIAIVELTAGPRVIGWFAGDGDPEIGAAVAGSMQRFEGLEDKRLVFHPLDKEI